MFLGKSKLNGQILHTHIPWTSWNLIVWYNVHIGPRMPDFILFGAPLVWRHSKFLSHVIQFNEVLTYFQVGFPHGCIISPISSSKQPYMIQIKLRFQNNPPPPWFQTNSRHHKRIKPERGCAQAGIGAFKRTCAAQEEQQIKCLLARADRYSVAWGGRQNVCALERPNVL